MNKQEIIENLEFHRDLWERNKDPNITTKLGLQYAQGFIDAMNWSINRIKEID